MYTCGPTVYDFAHIGNFRTFVFEDLLRRYLKYKSFQVKHVMNLTDVDDKTIRRSREEKRPLREVTDRYANAFFEDLEKLNIERAEVYPRATEHIPEMTALIQALLKRKYAYIAPDKSVYYSIKKFKKYGQLAHINIEELQAGASGRVISDQYEKAQASDFALWKAWDAEDGEVGWEAPFGKGRPGWHVECSAMSLKHLTNAFSNGFVPKEASTIDIHAGGEDLIFPHHEDEIAQSEGATRKKFVKYWLHSAFLNVEGKKMSKSLGNFFTLRDIMAKGYDPLSFRYAMLSVHYRQPLNFTFEVLEASTKAVQRLNDFVLRLKDAHAQVDNPKLPKLLERAAKRFERSLDNDLDISPALAAVFDLVSAINKLLDKCALSAADAQKTSELMARFDSVLGVLKKSEPLEPELQKLIDEREHCREIKNWARSDEIRDELKKRGIVIEDTPHGTRWKRVLS